MHSLSTKRYKDGILKVDKPVYIILIIHSYMLSCIVQYYYHLA